MQKENLTSERFNKATTALYNAFFNGTLAKGTCKMCAVGNIIAHSIGIEINNEDSSSPFYRHLEGHGAWGKLFYTSEKKQHDRRLEYNDSEIQEAIRLIKATGYTEDEMKKIEYAFETNTIFDACSSTYRDLDEQKILEDQYNGLVAVFDVLLGLEGIENNGHKEKLKTHPKLELQN